MIGASSVHLGVRESYQITMAGLAATRLLSAGGAGGLLLTYWALRKAGMKRVDAAERMVAFLVLLYAFYVARGDHLRGPARDRGPPRRHPVSMTIIPAAIAGGVSLVILADLPDPGRPPAAALAPEAARGGWAGWR